ncbi:hypothetical protein MHBO_001720 [Bonamia ostreae]|uniref:ZZ-type domain-containing protein n=1 Tax=Bonamia ostreae TaxID=126728 RepID=A0ABV2AJX6_9EUKA
MYEGDGVQCDECRKINIHLSSSGFYHCDNCGGVDLCDECAEKNSIRESSKSSFQSKNRFESSEVLTEPSEILPEESINLGVEERKTELKEMPSFWYLLFGEKWINDRSVFNETNHQKTKTEKSIKENSDKVHFDLIEKVKENPEKAKEYYFNLIYSGTMPNSFTYFILFDACCKGCGNSEFVHELVLHMKILGVVPNKRTVKALLKNFVGEANSIWKNRYQDMFSAV